MTSLPGVAASTVVLLLGGIFPASAMPDAPGLDRVERRVPLVQASTLCDARGCFTFGPVQSFRPAYVQPNYRPPGTNAPTYYRPSARGPAPLYNNPPPTPRPIVPEAAGRRGSHEQWCRNQYRTYNPRTDRFITYEGNYKTCNSPYD